MKRKIIFITLSLFILTLFFSFNTILATDVPTNNGYNFEVNYSGNIIEKEDKQATVVLEGTNATPYSNVRIKFDFISGPVQPTIIAYDAQGIGYNVVELGYWGPASGFAVGGTFRNETPIVATYREAGTYVTRLSLIDVNNGNQVITTKEFTQTVYPSTPSENIVNNTIEEIPQTGVSIWTYIGITIIIIVLIYLGYRFIKK